MNALPLPGNRLFGRFIVRTEPGKAFATILKPMLIEGGAAFDRVDAGDVTALTEAAIGATFYRDGMSAEQIDANHNVVAISGPTAAAAAFAAHQHFVAAFVGGAFAGFVVATRHAEDDLELDWLMVHPDFHGTPVARALMEAGMAWLGTDRPIWLTVIQHNARAIRFYRRFGFEIAGETDPKRVVPAWVMRRPGKGGAAAAERGRRADDVSEA